VQSKTIFTLCNNSSNNELVGRMLLWNGRNTQIDEIRISRNSACSVCGQAH
jgi:molybdopterin/thiamine biosynthesis adenylyltransferase